MSNLYYGSRHQVMADIEKLGNYRIVRDVPLDQFYGMWSSPTNPAIHIVFIDPKLEPPSSRPDRHIALIDKDVIPTLFKKWSILPKVNILKAVDLTPDQLYGLLTKGSLGLVFSPEAADLILTLRPTLQSLYWPIEQLKDIEVPQPVTINNMLAQWPKDVHVQAYDIFRSLGTPKAIDLANQVVPKKVWGGLSVLASMCKSRPDFRDYLEIAKDGIIDKRWTPKIGLILFTKLCYAPETTIKILQDVY